MSSTSPRDPIEVGRAARLLDGLDLAQRQAVQTPTNPLRILAGAGSGKTRVLTRRIAYRHFNGTAEATYVLALTFTRKAATELRDRLSRLGLRENPTVGTFHAVAWGQLRTFYRDRGETPPSLLEGKGRILSALSGRDGIRVAELASEIDWAQAREIRPEDYATVAAQHDRHLAGRAEQVSALMVQYRQAKSRRRVIDFDDILTKTADLLESDSIFSAAQRWRFRHLFVDEFQDVNPAQFRLLRGWMGGSNDLCVVGDSNQAIYRWNGADAGYLTNFERHFGGAATISLNANYRSTPQVVHAAQSVLGPSAAVRRSARPSGDLPDISVFATDVEEASEIASKVRLAHSPGHRWDRQAILVRTNAQMVLFEQALTRARIPVRLRGGDPLLTLSEVRIALKSITTRPGQTMAEAASDLKTIALDAALASADPDDPTRTDLIQGPLDSLARLASEFHRSDPAALAIDFRSWLATSAGLDGPGEKGDAISVVTFHAAKGLEWQRVYLCGLEEGLVPISMARIPEAEAEERRLLYVAMTRAEDHLHLSWARSRTVRDSVLDRKPSRYFEAIEVSLNELARAAHLGDHSDGLTQARAALGKRHLSSGEDRRLERLRQWRERVARGASLPPATVLSDRVISAVARLNPETDIELESIEGLGSSTRAAYGPELIAILDNLRKERPDAL